MKNAFDEWTSGSSDREFQSEWLNDVAGVPFLSPPTLMRSEFKIVGHIPLISDLMHDARSLRPFYLVSIQENSCVSSNGQLDLIIDIDQRTVDDWDSVYT